MKILFSGGGTLGPVSPLLAIYEQYKSHNNDCEFVWVGTKKGPEKELVESYSIPFFTIASGKFRRYVTIFNIIDLFKIVFSFFSLLFYFGKKNHLS